MGSGATKYEIAQVHNLQTFQARNEKVAQPRVAIMGALSQPKEEEVVVVVRKTMDENPSSIASPSCPSSSTLPSTCTSSTTCTSPSTSTSRQLRPATSLETSEAEYALNLSQAFSIHALNIPHLFKTLVEHATHTPGLTIGSAYLFFWREVNHLRSLPSTGYAQKKLRKVYEKFLSPRASTPICLPSSVRRCIDVDVARFDLNPTLHPLTAKVFLEAQRVCYVDLQTSLFPRFKTTKHYEKCRARFRLLYADASQDRGDDVDVDVDLDTMLQDPRLLCFFHAFCLESITLETFLFYQEIEECKRLPNSSFVHTKCRNICETFLANSGRYPLGLPQDHKLMIKVTNEAKENRFSSDMFNDLQAFVLQAIQDKIWPTFSQSPEYINVMSQMGNSTTCAISDYSSNKNNYNYNKGSNKTISNQRDPEMRDEDPERSSTRSTPCFSAWEAFNQKMTQTQSIDFNEVQMSHLLDVAKTLPLDQITSDYASEACSLRELTMALLSNHYGKRFLKMFVSKRSSNLETYLLLYEELREYKSLPGIEFIQQSAKKIYKKFIATTSRMQVDMSEDMRTGIQKKLENPGMHLFDSIAVRLRKQLLTESLPRYLQSAAFNQLLTKNTSAMTEIHAALMELKLQYQFHTLNANHLDFIVNNSTCCQSFHNFLNGEYCQENLLMYQEILNFRSFVAPYQYKMKLYAKIYKMVHKIKQNELKNPVPVCTSGETTSPRSKSSSARKVDAMLPFQTALSMNDIDLPKKENLCTDLKQVEKICLYVLSEDMLPDFLDSKLFMIMVGAWAFVDQDLARRMLVGEFRTAYLRHRFHELY